MQPGPLYLEELEHAIERKIRYMRTTKRLAAKPLIRILDDHFMRFREDLAITPLSMKLRPEARGNVIPIHSSHFPSFLALHLCLLPPSEIEEQLNYCQAKFAGNYYCTEERGFNTLLKENVRVNLGVFSIFAQRETLRIINKWIQNIFENSSTFAGSMIEFSFEKGEEKVILSELLKYTNEKQLANVRLVFDPGYTLPIYFNCTTNQIVEFFHRICFNGRTRKPVTQSRLRDWLCAKVGVIEKGKTRELRPETVRTIIKNRTRASRNIILPTLFAKEARIKSRERRRKLEQQLRSGKSPQKTN